jgi:outer membrane murein-binding lipoprotein Lpp
VDRHVGTPGGKIILRKLLLAVIGLAMLCGNAQAQSNWRLKQMLDKALKTIDELKGRVQQLECNRDKATPAIAPATAPTASLWGAPLRHHNHSGRKLIAHRSWGRSVCVLSVVLHSSLAWLSGCVSCAGRPPLKRPAQELSANRRQRRLCRQNCERPTGRCGSRPARQPTDCSSWKLTFRVRADSSR